MTFNVLMAGIGGQGVVSAADMLAKAAIRDDFDVRCADETGLAQRGGGVNSCVKLGYSVASPIIYPGTADVVLGFEPVEGARWAHTLKPSGLIIMNSRDVLPVVAKIGLQSFPDTGALGAQLDARGLRSEWVDASALAEAAGSSLALNSVMLGLLSATPNFLLETATLKEVIAETVPKKAVSINIKAFEAGAELRRV